MTLTAIFMVILTHASAGWAAAASVALALGNVGVYALMVRHHWRLPISFLLAKPS
jgi:adenine/guanine phosphoribosyltransferase-like PRPP-binding protein